MTWNKDRAKKYLEEKKALVVDQSLTSGRSLRKLLMGHGLRADLILVSDKFDEAKKLIEKFQPHVLVTDLTIGNGSGVELVQQHIHLMPDRLEASAIVMSMDSSSVNLGTLAEVQVDAVLLKPYTLQTLQECLNSALTQKLEPPPYLIQLEKGKRELKAGDTNGAILSFEQAMKDNAKYAPLYAAYAQAAVALNDLEKAGSLLKKGLQIDPQSFLCMSGLFDLYLGQKKYFDAYETAAIMYQKNPPSANRLLDLVRLSINCSKFEDIQGYCNHFKTLDTAEKSLNRVIIASMLISSRYFRTRGQTALATDALKDAARISIRTELLQAEVFRYLIENQDQQAADQFFSQMIEDVRNKPEVSLLRMELLFQFNDYAQVMTLGQTLVKNKTDTPRVYELMIESSRKLNRSEQAIENLILESQSRHPTQSR